MHSDFPVDDFRQRWEAAKEKAYDFYSHGTRGSFYDPARSDDWLTRCAADVIYFSDFAEQQGRKSPGMSLRDFCAEEDKRLNRKSIP